MSSDSGELVLRFEDLDGNGGNEPADPVQNINTEILAEAEDHQFFFSNDLDMFITYDDQDANNKPLGLKTKVSDLNPGAGTLKVILRHEPNKSASGVADGDISNAGGETDIEVTFPITIE